MLKLISIIAKEFKLLLRDPAGFFMLFLLPVTFILVLSIALQGTFSSLDKKEKLEIIVVNSDIGDTGQRIIDGLEEIGYFKCIQKIDNKVITLEDAKEELQKGNYKIAINIPPETTESLDFKNNSSIDIYIDPVLSSEFAANITNSVQNFVYLSIIKNISKITNNIFNDIKKKRIETLTKQLAETTSKREEIKDQLDEFMNAQIDDDMKVIIKDLSESNISELTEKINELSSEMKDINGKTVSEGQDEYAKLVKDKVGITVNQIYYTASSKDGIYPNSVQQNVPGWTIFALFWIVQILSLNIIGERQTGAFKRILIAPVSTWQYFTGKIVPFFVINILQAACMFAIGVYILPLFGAPQLVIKNIFGVFLITFGISLTAITLGLLIATASKTMALAASLSASLLILMTVFGGIMVPKFIMPRFMQTLSYITPHGWALDGYLKLFVKDYSTIEIIPNFLVLLLFSLIFGTISFILFSKRIKIEK